MVSRPFSRSAWLIAYTLVVTLLCIFVFTGNGLMDTVAFVALLVPLFMASDFDKTDPQHRVFDYTITGPVNGPGGTN